MGVVVPFNVGLDAAHKGIAIGSKAIGRHYDIVANVKDLGFVSRVDAVASCVSGVACKHGKVLAGNAENSATIVVVRVKLVLDRASGGLRLRSDHSVRCGVGREGDGGGSGGGGDGDES